MDRIPAGVRHGDPIPKREAEQERGRLIQKPYQSPRRGRSMNKELYQDLVIWLERREVRADANDWTKNILLTKSRKFILEEGILYRKQGATLLPVIQEGKTLEFIQTAHDASLSGHMGQKNTYFRLQDAVWWPGMQDDITEYVRSCDVCQKQKKDKE